MYKKHFWYEVYANVVLRGLFQSLFDLDAHSLRIYRHLQ